MFLKSKIDFSSVKNGIRGMIKRLSYQQPGWRKVAPMLIDSCKKNFENQGVGGIKWPLRKRENKSPWPILYKSGDLYRSIKPEYQRRKLIIKSTLAYSATHQYGDPSRNIPCRQYLYVPYEVAKRAIYLFDYWIING